MSPQYAGKGKTILVVGDDSTVVSVAEETLSLCYEVLTVQTVEAAIQVVQHFPSGVDLLIVDAAMRQMSGPELADILLFLRPAMKVLFITRIKSMTIRLAFDRPCGCLHEPLTARFLVSKVQEALGDAVRPVRSEV